MNLGAISSINNQVLSRTCVNFKSPFDALVLLKDRTFFFFYFPVPNPFESQVKRS